MQGVAPAAKWSPQAKETKPYANQQAKADVMIKKQAQASAGRE
jgi:hypothetical protein